MPSSSFLSLLASPLTGYTHWLHTRWPAGTVEHLPEVGPDGETNLHGVRIVGDLGGIPLLKFSADTGAKAVQALLREPDFKKNGGGQGETLDLAILGAGVSGISAALEAKQAGLKFQVFEAADPFSTIVNFPKAKPIYTYPTDMTPAGQMHFHADVKEALLDELERQRKDAVIEVVHGRADRIESGGGGVTVRFTGDNPPPDVRARRVIIAIGRTGDYRRLNVPGEELDKVSNRLIDPHEFAGKNVLVVGGGDSALESAIALGTAGAHVTVSYRKTEFNRPKGENVEKLKALEADPNARVQVEQPKGYHSSPAVTMATHGGQGGGSVTLALGSAVVRVEPASVTLKDENGERTLDNDVVFTMIGREAPLAFFRRSRMPIINEWTWWRVLGCLAFVTFCFLFYHWKGGHPQEVSIGGKSIHDIFQDRGWFPFNLPGLIDRTAGEWSRREGNLLYTLKNGFGDPSWDYGFLYSVIVVVFGIIRIRRRKTPYVTRQTLVLMAVQVILLFVIPDILLAWMGRNGWFEPGHPLRGIADHLFESYDGPRGHERAYWRAIGFVLAWPLLVYNVFMDQPNYWWLGISFVQTFVLIPLIVWRWGKGAYCGWLCSCGALAENARRRATPQNAPRSRLEPAQHARAGRAGVCLHAAGLADRRLGDGSAVAAVAVVQERLRDDALPQLPVERGPVPERCAGHRPLLLVQRADVVPVRVSAGGADAHLRAVHALPHLPREEEVHLVQRLHERLPPGDRRDELRQQGLADGRSAVRALLGVRAGVPHRRVELRAPRRRRQDSPRPPACLAGADEGSEAREMRSAPLDVWIDTDPSIGIPGHEADDGFALIQAFQSPELRIRGLSVSYGNAALRRVLPIAREMAARFGAGAGVTPEHVFAGAASRKELGTATPATAALRAALEERPLTYLALAPLTNLATLLERHPELAGRIERVIFVGGRTPGHRFRAGNWNPYEFTDGNYHKDPPAMGVVLRAGDSPDARAGGTGAPDAADPRRTALDRPRGRRGGPLSLGEGAFVGVAVAAALPDPGRNRLRQLCHPRGDAPAFARKRAAVCHPASCPGMGGPEGRPRILSSGQQAPAGPRAGPGSGVLLHAEAGGEGRAAGKIGGPVWRGVALTRAG